MRNVAGKKTAIALVSVTLLASAGWGQRATHREAPADLVAHGPFLVPRASLASGVPVSPGRPGGSVSRWVHLLRSFPVPLQWEKVAFTFIKADITGNETITTVAGG